MIIDFHTHCFPEKIAGKALSALSHSAALMPYTDGTLNDLFWFEKHSGVDKFVVNNIATNEKQQKNVNDFAISINKDNVIAFGSVFPFAEDAEQEIDRIADAGLLGLKFHPEFQNFYPDDEKVLKLYKKAESRGLVMTFHAGEDLGFRAPVKAAPERFEKILKAVDTPVVMAHWGGAGMGEEVLAWLEKFGKPDNLYFDLSFGYQSIALPTACKIAEKMGPERLLFGTDCPWHEAQHEFFLIDCVCEKLGFGEKEKNLIYAENASRILDL